MKPKDGPLAVAARQLGRRMLMAHRARRQWVTDRVQHLYDVGIIGIRECHHFTCPAVCTCKPRLTFRMRVNVCHRRSCDVRKRCTCTPQLRAETL